MTPDAERCINIVYSDKVEGRFQKWYNDSGNWTGGAVGKGKLVGTNHGISAAAYPMLDIPNLTKEKIYELYFNDYWQANKCGDVPLPVGLMLFDACVMSNNRRAIRWLQNAVGVTEDGIIGQHTVDAANQAPNRAAVINRMAENRTTYLSGLKRANENPGWFIRVAYIRGLALGMLNE